MEIFVAGVMEMCTKGLGSSVNQLKQRGVSLSCVRTCVVVAEERPRINLTSSFSKLFSALGLSPRAVSTSFGCRVNIAICLQVTVTPSHGRGSRIHVFNSRSFVGSLLRRVHPVRSRRACTLTCVRYETIAFRWWNEVARTRSVCSSRENCCPASR